MVPAKTYIHLKKKIPEIEIYLWKKKKESI